MRQILSKGQLVVCWALGLWCSVLLIGIYADTKDWVRGSLLPAVIIAGLALLTLELRKRKTKKEGKPTRRDKLASRIIAFSLLFIAAALTTIAVKTLVGGPPTKEKDIFEEWRKQISVEKLLKQPVREEKLSALDRRLLRKDLYEIEASYWNIFLLEAKIHYTMLNPTSFLYVDFHYDRGGEWGKTELPESVDTDGKICVHIRDNRGIFSDKSGAALLGQFKRTLESIYRTSSIAIVDVDMDTDIVAMFCSKENIPLGYFYQGEYHLWEK